MKTRYVPILVCWFLATVSPSPGQNGIETIRVASGLNAPVWVAFPPNEPERLFIVEQRGVVKIMNLATGEMNSQNFLNIQEQVLLVSERGASRFPRNCSPSHCGD